MMTGTYATVLRVTEETLIFQLDAKMLTNAVGTHVLQAVFATIQLGDTCVLVEQEENWKATHATLILA